MFSEFYGICICIQSWANDDLGDHHFCGICVCMQMQSWGDDDMGDHNFWWKEYVGINMVAKGIKNTNCILMVLGCLLGLLWIH